MVACISSTFFFFFLLLLLLPHLFPLLPFRQISCAKTDTVTATLSLRDGDGETAIVSSNGTFELGFFSPGQSRNRYVGIWYNSVSPRTVVWVANRQIPLNATSGVFRIVKPGSLVLLDGASNRTVWSINSSRSTRNPVAQLLDSGNLVFRDGDGEADFLWQSFDYPTDTYLPGMNIGRNLLTAHDIYLTSWKSSEDPGTGDYTYSMSLDGYPQNFIMKGSVVMYRSGPWTGSQFSGSPNSRKSPFYEIGFVFNQTEAYFTNQLLDSVLTRATLNPNGVLERTIWVPRTRGWTIYLTVPTDTCDTYKLCGANGQCSIQSSPLCGCLDRFVPKKPSDWVKGDWSGGCVRRMRLSCNGDGFLKYSGIKLPDTKNVWFNQTMTLQECNARCLKNCTCMAYSNLEVRNGCFMWFGDLLDIRLAAKEGQDIYIRLAAPELVAGVLMLTLVIVASYIRWRKHSEPKHEVRRMHNNESNNDEFELPLFDFSTLIKATDSFSAKSKIGEGGYGPVHKGMLDNGHEIAVKRLSKTSTQGHGEFKNEVLCIAKLQHRNLVRMLGCCIEGDDKLLVYEFMPNGSLDTFIFDEAQSRHLDWPKRFQIINGVARGLTYLHHDSRLRIIHRDLKASNILLDSNMEPKISDFGIARSFGGNEIEAKTNIIVGTYGYISPEYAARGLYSVKSDVFSFGVLVLEIVTGKRNTKFCHPDSDVNLVGHVSIRSCKKF
ncbi:unnamed protein product [Cuscuta campestris]|uniref:Receptor-like serine/threonine-protein kinase n=1 Tax=Cuscuta campestris TaxID=132261 RepID=A0A484KGK1_9ASTE|nr:unnamed protein product [Cuscuta campestris]